MSTPNLQTFPRSRGWADFNDGKYWEAHEVWEHEWHRLPPGPEKLELQAWIQVAGVAHLLGLGRVDAARRLALLAWEKLEQTSWSSCPEARDWIQKISIFSGENPPIQEWTSCARTLRGKS